MASLNKTTLQLMELIQQAITKIH